MAVYVKHSLSHTFNAHSVYIIIIKRGRCIINLGDVLVKKRANLTGFYQIHQIEYSNFIGVAKEAAANAIVFFFGHTIETGPGPIILKALIK